MRIWIGNGRGGSLVDSADARVSVLDHGFTVADGVFETLKVVRGVPFALTRHLRRLDASIDGMGLDPVDHAQVRAAIAEVVQGNPDAQELGRLRITWTAGPGPLGSERSQEPGTLVVALAPAASWADATSACTVAWTRNERSSTAGVKSTSYAENVVALRYARSRGCSEALLANTVGELCEGTGTNVLVVLGDAILTPPLSSGCLAGITRELAIEWLGVREQSMPVSVLAEAEEVLLASSTRDLHPVAELDGRALPTAKGAALRHAFIERANAGTDP